MTKLRDVVVDFLENSGRIYEELEIENSWKVPFAGTHGQWDCYARVREQQQQFAFYSILPTTIAADRRTEVALLLSRINYGLLIGNFEIDLNDGEVRFKTSIDVADDRLSAALVKTLVFRNVATMNKHFLAIMAVLNGDEPPTETEIVSDESDQGA